MNGQWARRVEVASLLVLSLVAAGCSSGPVNKSSGPSTSPPPPTTASTLPPTTTTTTAPGKPAKWELATISSPNGLMAVSCPSAHLCVAVDNHGHAVISTNPTGGDLGVEGGGHRRDQCPQRRRVPEHKVVRCGGRRRLGHYLDQAHWRRFEMGTGRRGREPVHLRCVLPDCDFLRSGRSERRRCYFERPLTSSFQMESGQYRWCEHDRLDILPEAQLSA